ncbi:hypothetical protein BZG36_02141 [Bifiguratus adelaidae]|uniref:ER membrane protein complex subunit 6 n=1 Tax=Bifiguratus adelaidae TaxID=1938954 RepID=A0A261Y357_9FUNG|nr:hypothetical protein BZG36_02141 [Bifiguratus adelaidae]
MSQPGPLSTKEATRYVPAHMAHNAQVILFIRSTTAAITGSAAGILGLTNWSGFLFYAVTWVLSTLLIISMKAKGKLGLYFVDGGRHVWTEGLFGSLFSYVLFHTFLYGLVHLYQ